MRELITSTTIAAISDLPFFLLFVFILWMIGGPLVLVVLLAVPLLLIPGLLVQRPLGKLSSEGMRESAIRNATLVEAVQGLRTSSQCAPSRGSRTSGITPMTLPRASA